MVPRIDLGAHSDWYMGTKHEMIPTPRPAITRPMTKVTHCVSSWRPIPRKKTTQPETIPYLRPRRSPMGYAMRAPKKVPADRIETYRTEAQPETTRRKEETYDEGLVFGGEIVTECAVE